MPHVSGAFVDKDIILCMNKDAALDKEALGKMLKEHKITLNEMKKTDDLPF